MIKKILSVVLTVAMLLTLVSSLPVAAAGEVLPYIFENFEADGNAAGPYGIGKALKTEGAYTKDIAGMDELFAGNVKVSFNIKADEVTSAKIALVSEYDLGELPANEWVTIEEVIEVNGNIADTFAIVADSAFAIDDLKVENADIPEVPGADEFVASETRYSFGFESDTSAVNLYKLNTSGEVVDANDKIESAAGGQTGNYAAVSYRNSGVNTLYFELLPSEANKVKKYNTLTKVSFYALGDRGTMAGATVTLSLGDAVDFYGKGFTVDGNEVAFRQTLANGEWKYYEVYYKRDAENADSDAENITISVTAGNKSIYIGLDEVKVTDYYIPAEADFEALDAWTAVGAEVEAVDGQTDSGAMVTATASKAGVAQSLALETDKKYTFSFYAKGEDNSVGKTVSVKLGETAKTCGTLTENWSVFTATFRVEDDALIVYPDIEISVSGLAADDVYYVDTLGMVRDNNYKLAYADEVAVEGDIIEKGEITISYEEVADEDIAVVATVVNLFQAKGDYVVCVGSAKETGSDNEVSLTLPEYSEGDEFYAEIICFTAAGEGITVPVEIGAVASPVEVTGSAVLADNAGEIEVSVENLRAEGANVKAVVLVVLLDENGVLVGWNADTVIDLAAGENDTFTASAEATNGTATQLKAFVLDCGEAAPSLASTTMKELAVFTN